MKIPLLCALLLSGCAATTPSLSPLHMQPVQAQFGLRFSHGDNSLPLQGAVQFTEDAGSLGVIFPHGRTLGLCRYQRGGMECVPADGERGGTRFMLRQVGLAVYRVLPALTRESAQDSIEKDWTVYWKEADSGRKAEYRDLNSQVTLEILFTEISQP